MSTENIHFRAQDIDVRSIKEIIDLMNDEDFVVAKAVQKAMPDINRAVEDAVKALRSGGRLIYAGAGTSGRLGVLDASEIFPTFGIYEAIKAIIAGGDSAVTKPVEGAEDSSEDGKKSVTDVKENDMLLGITASGKTPFVIAALKDGKHRNARCWLLTCNDVNYDFLDGVINVMTGPEIVAGSTRLKAGTATKMVLNMISTAAMIQLGHVYKGHMVDVVPSSGKLINRALTMIQEITGCSREDAKVYLRKADNNPKTAVLMYINKLSCESAVMLLKDCEGSLRRALE